MLAKASERFADDGTPRERIASVDDRVLFKVKVQRWRGAVWRADDGIPWLVAADQREQGSPDDFYASLTARGKTASSQYNTAHTPPVNDWHAGRGCAPLGGRRRPGSWRMPSAAQCSQVRRCRYIRGIFVH